MKINDAAFMGSFAMVTIGDVTVPVESFALHAEPTGEPTTSHRPRANFKTYGAFKVTLTLTYNFAALEDRRWLGWLARAFRNLPGMRFADLMRGPGRN